MHRKVQMRILGIALLAIGIALVPACKKDADRNDPKTTIVGSDNGRQADDSADSVGETAADSNAQSDAQAKESNGVRPIENQPKNIKSASNRGKSHRAKPSFRPFQRNPTSATITCSTKCPIRVFSSSPLGAHFRSTIAVLSIFFTTFRFAFWLHSTAMPHRMTRNPIRSIRLSMRYCAACSNRFRPKNWRLSAYPR